MIEVLKITTTIYDTTIKKYFHYQDRKGIYDPNTGKVYMKVNLRLGKPLAKKTRSKRLCNTNIQAMGTPRGPQYFILRCTTNEPVQNWFLHQHMQMVKLQQTMIRLYQRGTETYSRTPTGRRRKGHG